MPGVRVFAGTQYGFEATAGTDVPATAVYRGPVAFPVDESPVMYPVEDIGISGGSDRSLRPYKLAALSFPKAVATYEQLPIFYASGVKNVVTGAADGSGTGKVYTYPVPTTAANTIKSQTVEGFDDQQEYESEYVFISEINLSGKMNEPWYIDAKAFGRQVTPSTKTPALPLIAVRDILFQNTSLYIDAIGGTIGTTQKTSTFLGFDIKLHTGWKAQPTGDANLYFTFAKYVGYKLTGKIVLEHDAIAKAQFDIFQASTAQLMQIKAVGPAVTTPGTTYSNLTAILNMPFKYTKVSEVKDQDGNDVLEFEFESKYNTTAAVAASTVLVNEVSAL